MRSACDRGYLAVTVSNGCATQNEELHLDALQRLKRLIGPVADTDEMLELIAGISAKPLPASRRTFDMEEIGKKMAEGLSLNDIVDWKQYLDRDSTALLVIDPQNDNLHPEGSLSFTGSWKQAKESGAITRIKTLLQSCRKTGMPVFWCKQNRLPGGRDIFPGTFDKQVMDVIHNVIPDAFIGGNWDTDFFDDIKPLIGKDEMVIEKATWSALEATPLERYLNQLGITGLIVCGFLTDFCVEATVRNASDRGFFSIIISDACAAATAEDHTLALARFDRLIGPVVDTKTIVDFLK